MNNDVITQWWHQKDWELYQEWYNTIFRKILEEEQLRMMWGNIKEKPKDESIKINKEDRE